MSQSPLIKNGKLSLDDRGNLVAADDIITQLTVAIGAYGWAGNPTVNSALILYLTGIPKGGLRRTAITHIVKNALQPLITNKSISDLGIAITILTPSIVKITIDVVNIENTAITLSWSNVIL